MTITVGRYPASTRCNAIFPVARESKTRVSLFLKDVTPWHGHSCGGYVTAPTDTGLMSVAAFSIRLRGPLGTRKLVDGATGQAIPWISARLVLRLPGASYQLKSIEPTGYLSGAREVEAGVTQYYAAQLHGATGLFIVQSAGSVHMPGPGPGGWFPIRVRGHPGRATSNLITWRENGLIDYMQIDVVVDYANPDAQCRQPSSSLRSLTARQPMATGRCQPAARHARSLWQRR